MLNVSLPTSSAQTIQNYHTTSFLCTFPMIIDLNFQGGKKTFIKLALKERIFGVKKVKRYIEFTFNLLKIAVKPLIEKLFLHCWKNHTKTRHRYFYGN